MSTRSSRLGQILLHLVLAVGGAILFLPFVWMLLTAFRMPDEAFEPIGSWAPSIESFRQVLDEVSFGRLYLNGLIVSGGILLGQLLVGLPAGYALARLRFRGRGLVYALVIAGLILPAQAFAIPSYLLLNELGLLNTRTGLIVPFIGSSFAIFLFRQYLLSVPQSVFDAARIDGAGPIGVVWRVVLPLARPALVAHGVFSFVFHWNDLFWPTLTLRDRDAATVPFGIVQFVSEEAGSRYGPQMAAAVLAIAPLVVGFLVAQRQFIQGVALSGHHD